MTASPTNSQFSILESITYLPELAAGNIIQPSLTNRVGNSEYARQKRTRYWKIAPGSHGFVLDACSPHVPQLHLGTSWIIMCSRSAGTPRPSNVFVMPLISFSFCSSVLPCHISMITTGMTSPLVPSCTRTICLYFHGLTISAFSLLIPCQTTLYPSASKALVASLTPSASIVLIASDRHSCPF